MRRLLRGAVATCLTFAVGVSSCVAVRSRDLPDPGDADLLRGRVDGPSDENAYPALRAALEELSYPVDDAEFMLRVKRTLRGEQELDEQQLAVLAANRAALDHVRSALAARRLGVRELEATDRTQSGRYPLLARLLALEAHRLARRGEVQRSIQTHLEVIELGYRLESAEGGVLIDAMSGLSMKNIASESLRGALARIEIRADDARRAARELAAYRSSPESWSRMWAEEYRLTKGIVLSAYAKTPPPEPGVSLSPLSWLPASYTYQPNRTFASFADLYRTRQEMSSHPCAQVSDGPGTMHASAWKQTRIRTILDRNSVGNVLVALTEPNLERFDERRCLADTSLAATQALLGLRAYQREHGELPDDLTALVPRYLESLPRDGFDDAVLRYSRSARWLYSPGSDRVDQGGEKEYKEGNEFMREPTYPIRF